MSLSVVECRDVAITLFQCSLRASALVWEVQARSETETGRRQREAKHRLPITNEFCSIRARARVLSPSAECLKNR